MLNKKKSEKNCHESFNDENYKPAFKIIEVKKKAFGQKCYMAHSSENISEIENYVFDWTKKSRKLEIDIETIFVK